MLEILQYVTSGFWVFIGTIILISAMGWAINAILLGIHGKKCDDLF